MNIITNNNNKKKKKKRKKKCNLQPVCQILNFFCRATYSHTLWASLVLFVFLALWSNKTLIKSVRSLKSQWMISSKGTLLASQPVPRPPEPFGKRFSPPPPMKRRWSRCQSFSATALSTAVWIRFWGISYWIPQVPPELNTWYETSLWTIELLSYKTNVCQEIEYGFSD